MDKGTVEANVEMVVTACTRKRGNVNKACAELPREQRCPPQRSALGPVLQT